jgi:hypothetical protein
LAALALALWTLGLLASLALNCFALGLSSEE